jgi:hypothetical protein
VVHLGIGTGLLITASYDSRQFTASIARLLRQLLIASVSGVAVYFAVRQGLDASLDEVPAAALGAVAYLVAAHASGLSEHRAIVARVRATRNGSIRQAP